MLYSHTPNLNEVPFIQEYSGIYNFYILDTDELKMALRARQVCGSFDKQAPGPEGNS